MNRRLTAHPSTQAKPDLDQHHTMFQHVRQLTPCDHIKRRGAQRARSPRGSRHGARVVAADRRQAADRPSRRSSGNSVTVPMRPGGHARAMNERQPTHGSSPHGNQTSTLPVAHADDKTTTRQNARQLIARLGWSSVVCRTQHRSMNEPTLDRPSIHPSHARSRPTPYDVSARATPHRL